MLWKKNNSDLDEFTEDSYLEQKFDFKGKRILLLLVPIIISIIAVVLYLFMFVFDKEDKHTQTKTSTASSVKEMPTIVYIEMNDIISTLMPNDSKQNFLKLSISLVIENKKEAEIIATKINIIKDSFQGFFRELRPDDLSGSAGLIMLRTELLKRANKILAPAQIKDILFKEILLS